MLDTACQAISKTGIQLQSLANRKPKVILTSQTPEITPPDAANQREKTVLHPPEYRHKSIQSRSLHKPLGQCYPLGG